MHGRDEKQKEERKMERGKPRTHLVTKRQHRNSQDPARQHLLTEPFDRTPNLSGRKGDEQRGRSVGRSGRDDGLLAVVVRDGALVVAVDDERAAEGAEDLGEDVARDELCRRKGKERSVLLEGRKEEGEGEGAPSRGNRGIGRGRG